MAEHKRAGFGYSKNRLLKQCMSGKTNIWVWIMSFTMLLQLLCSCKEAFEADIGVNSKHALIVEGYINIGPGATQIKLSNATALDTLPAFDPETGASISIENSSGEIYLLSEEAPGIYRSTELNLAPDRYRLLITTISGDQYASEFVEHILTPPIDSVSWTQAYPGVNIYVSTHDPTNLVKYYRWEYEEAWETRSAFKSRVRYVNSQILYRDSLERERMYTCYKYGKTPDLILGSTERFTNSIVTLKELLFIPSLSDKLGVKYSVLVKQHALDKSAYRFYEIMQSNSNDLGSFFDRQPSQLIGNLTCLTSDKLVIGYIGVYSTQTYRLTIVNDNSLAWRTNTSCREFFVTPDSLEFYLSYYNTPTRIFTDGDVESDSIPDIDGVFAAPNFCTDCRLSGGTNVQPPFWTQIFPEP